ncbi:MAG: hypothetical protein JJLCMIEE_03586 [Acidimicrobiales bacterium]|nr:MAG: DUF4263 domain-containing protein [Actinomycetota bacterium]MBV6510439.1 hypothetical protein [Acidimicrobiales bacterium]RIK03756.1 MAG: DUF4263 domain-containing protein [Acidobacteriota bacterium]
MVDQPIRGVVRRTARSGRIDYIPPVEIHDTRDSRIELVTWLIPRSEGTDVGLKLVRHDKTEKEPPREISFDPAAGRRLLRAIGEHNAIAAYGREASYLVISVEGGTQWVGHLDPAVIVNAVAAILREEDIVQHLTDVDVPHEMVTAFKGVIRLRELQLALDQLRSYLDGGVSDEHTYQRWCEEHSWAFGNAYVVNDKIRTISRSDQIDLLLPRVLGGFRDLIELKRPDKRVISYDDSHRNWYLTSDVSKAIGQCHRYLDVLEEDARYGMRDARDVIAYHPRATIVIGRSSDWSDDQHRALHGLNARLAGISIMTYDHLLAQGNQTLRLVSNPPEEEIIVPQFDDSEARGASNDPQEQWNQSSEHDEAWPYSSDEEPF